MLSKRFFWLVVFLVGGISAYLVGVKLSDVALPTRSVQDIPAVVSPTVCGHEVLIGELKNKVADLERQLAEEKALTRKFLLEALEAQKERDAALAASHKVQGAEDERVNKTKDRFRDLFSGLNAIKDPAEREAARFRLKRDLEEQFWPLLAAYGDPLKAFGVFELLTSIRDSGEIGGESSVASLIRAEGVNLGSETATPISADIRRDGGVRRFWEKRMEGIFGEGRGAQAIQSLRNLYPLPEGVHSPNEWIPLDDPRSRARMEWKNNNPFPPFFWED